jgi:hypothetical protein
MHLGDPQANIGDLIARLAAIALAMIVIYVLLGVIPWRIMEKRAARKFFDTATRYGDSPPQPEQAAARQAISNPVLQPQRP